MDSSVEDFTQKVVEETGVFRAFPVAWTVEASTAEDSHSVAIAFRFAIDKRWAGKGQGWSQEYPMGWFVENRTWVIKKDGTLNEKAIANLKKCDLWDGDWDKIAGPPPSVYVLIDVAMEQYEGKPQFRANWINPDAPEPQPRGGFAPADSKLLVKLRSQFGSKTRAIAGGGPAAGEPTKPPAPPQIGGAATAPAKPAAKPAAAAQKPPTPQRAAAPAAPAAHGRVGRPQPRPAIEQAVIGAATEDGDGGDADGADDSGDGPLDPSKPPF